MRGLSPTSQFSPSGGAGGNAPTRDAEMPTRPSKALALAPLARCREVTWLVRAIAGVASVAVAISAADSSLSLVIYNFSVAYEKPTAWRSSMEMEQRLTD